jgi:hypothetical protein
VPVCTGKPGAATAGQAVAASPAHTIAATRRRRPRTEPSSS